MGYLATDVARLKLVGFDWYVFFLEDNYQDDLRKELADNFAVVARELGPDSIAIRGTDRAHFYGALFERYAMAERGVDGGYFPLPALMITDTAPRELEDDTKDRLEAKVILLPLGDKYRRPGSISEILAQVVAAVRDPEAMAALENPTADKTNSKWGWLTRYFELKPSFCGFGVDLDAILDDHVFAKG